MLIVGLSVLAFGRPLLNDGRPARPPEAWYTLGGPTTCPAEVIVGADGRMIDARPVGCPEILSDGIVEALGRWRWARASSRSVEQVRVPVQPPEFTPRPARGACLVGVRIDEGSPTLLAEPPGRCGIQITHVPDHAPVAPRPTAWCAVTASVESGQVRSLTADACAEGFAGFAVEAVRSWTLDTTRDQSWTVLVGYAAAN